MFPIVLLCCTVCCGIFILCISTCLFGAINQEAHWRWTFAELWDFKSQCCACCPKHLDSNCILSHMHMLCNGVAVYFIKHLHAICLHVSNMQDAFDGYLCVSSPCCRHCVPHLACCPLLWTLQHHDGPHWGGLLQLPEDFPRHRRILGVLPHVDHAAALWLEPLRPRRPRDNLLSQLDVKDCE